MRTMALVLAAVFGWAGVGVGAPDPAALAAQASRHERFLSQPSGWQLAAGLVEVRDSSPQSLLLLELQFPVWRYFRGALTGILPSSRTNLQYQYGLGLHFYSRPHYRGFWVHTAYFKDANRVGDSESRVRAGVGWRWHATDAPASFGLSIGPERALDAKTWGGVIRLDVGTDFSIGQVFW